MKPTAQQTEALKEVIGISAGQAAASLSELTDMRIKLSVLTITMFERGKMADAFEFTGHRAAISVGQGFNGMISGRVFLLFSQTSAASMAELLCGQDVQADESDLAMRGILTEVGNIVLNSVLGSLANLLDTRLSLTLPEYRTDQTVAQLLSAPSPRHDSQSSDILVADAKFNAEQRDISARLVIALDAGGIETILDAPQRLQTAANREES